MVFSRSIEQVLMSPEIYMSQEFASSLLKNWKLYRIAQQDLLHEPA